MCPVNVGSCMLLEYGCFHDSSFMSFCFTHQSLQACVLQTSSSMIMFLVPCWLAFCCFRETNLHKIPHGLSFSLIKNSVLGRLLNCLGVEDKKKTQQQYGSFLKSFLEDFFTVIYPIRVGHTHGYKVCMF